MRTPVPIKPVVPNVVDRVVTFFSPEKGLARLKSRAQMAIAGQWYGARFDRRATNDWIPYGGSGDSDTIYDLRWLRNRSRDLMRNNPLALGAVNTVVTNAVGTGLVMRSTIDAVTLGLSQDQAQELQSTIEREFKLWSSSADNCDATRTNNFYELQALAFRSALESGDVFSSLPMIPRRSSAYSMKIQLIEADRVINKDYAVDSDRLVQGIERDEYGAPVKYHILKRHPGGLMPAANLEWDVIPAFGAKTGRRNILHLYDKRRPGQSRGVPYIAPVIELLKQLGDYTTAEVTAAVVSGMFTVFVKSENAQGLDLSDDGGKNDKSGSVLEMGAGAILDLAPGEDVTFADPKRPNTAFDPFLQAILRQIGVALELPFEVLVKHFTASYSAARAALLEVWRFYKGRRAWLAEMFCQPVYEAWLEEAIARGRIDAPGFFDDPTIRAAYCSAEWIGDSPGQLDPLKEVNAAKGRLELNLTCHSSEATAMTGEDWNSTIERRAREEQKMKALGLTTIYAPLTPANMAVPAPATDPKDDQSDTDLEKT